MVLMGRSVGGWQGWRWTRCRVGGIVGAVEARGGRQRSTATDACLRWVVLTVWVVTVVLVVMALVLLAMNGPAPSFGRIAAAHGQRTVAAAAGALCTLAFATVGATIVWHRRRQVVGWLFCLVGVALAVQAFAAFYATHALVASPGSLRGGQVLGWVGSWVSAPALLLVPLFCFLLFPDVRLPALLLPLAVAASVGSLIVRLRRARGAQRQQLKWFASAAALVAVIAIPVLPAQAVAPTRWADAGLVVLIIAIACLPVSAGIAILRYRLFDIDVLLNRALVYSTVTSMLGAGYAGMVLGVGPVLGGAGVGGARGGQGGGSVSSFAVALATLAVAAMFQPARRWVQDVVDRRFNRRRCNAQRTVEAFAAQLRQQTDLDALVSELIAVVDRTVEPTQVSLWLRPTADGRSRAALLIGGGQ